MTKYAEKILDIVEHSDCHMTAEQVFDRLRRDFPRVALATVYNNLNRLAEEGHIRRLSVEGMPDRFDRTQRHDHLLCRRCGALEDIRLSDLTAWLEKETGIPILAYDLKLLYLCNECRRRVEEQGEN